MLDGSDGQFGITTVAVVDVIRLQFKFNKVLLSSGTLKHVSEHFFVKVVKQYRDFFV